MWPFRRKRDPEPTTEAKHAVAEASRAAEDMQHAVASERERWPEVVRVAKSLQNARTRNHFSEAIERLMRGA